jgi:hypothetical protein
MTPDVTGTGTDGRKVEMGDRAKHPAEESAAQQEQDLRTGRSKRTDRTADKMKWAVEAVAAKARAAAKSSKSGKSGKSEGTE